MFSGSAVTGILMIAVTMVLGGCGREGQRPIGYPAPMPDSVAMRFLPGVVSDDSLDFNSAFSPDGKRFYFSRSGKGKWIIYVTEEQNGTWTQPAPAPFNEPQYSQADPFITADGTLYYISNRPRDLADSIPDYDIWRVRPRADGSWTSPENLLAVNSDSTEYYVSLSANGNLYFASNRNGTLGSHDIYVSHYANGKYTTPENLGQAVNSDKMEHDPMVSQDEKYLIFTSVDRADSFGSGDLYYSVRNANGTWAQAENMGSKFNTDTYEYCSYLTPDNRYLFFSADYDVKWISAQQLPWFK
ncbi:hypothetical protein [Dyadobacter sp. 676]|uniref:PD40 domain-containing protein n=1 Tax=Dyadobacter sp. 676 TaxID=3088362 RepID=A0AAU8FLG3_9BACT